MTLGYTCLTKHDLDYPSTHGGQASQVPGIAGAASFGWQQGPGQKSLGSTCWRCTYESRAVSPCFLFGGLLLPCFSWLALSFTFNLLRLGP